MSNGLRTRIAIGQRAPMPRPTPRTLQQAFGAHATYDGLTRAERSVSARVDRIIGRFCAVVICAALAALVVSRWGM